MDMADLVFHYAKATMFFIAMILYLRVVIRNKDLVPLVDAVSKKTARKVNIITKIVVGIYFIMVLEAQTIPSIRDIPYILENKYETVTGYAVSVDNVGTDTIELREFLIEDENHQRIRVHVYTDKVNMGDYMKINYLPHTHVGTVVERSKQE